MIVIVVVIVAGVEVLIVIVCAISVASGRADDLCLNVHVGGCCGCVGRMMMGDAFIAELIAARCP